jgi:hypothetical protein
MPSSISYFGHWKLATIVDLLMPILVKFAMLTVRWLTCISRRCESAEQGAVHSIVFYYVKSLLRRE